MSKDFDGGVTTMNNPITATYENGVLRPMTPLDLPEYVKVRIIVEPLEIPKEVKENKKPTNAELWAELDNINVLEPDIEIPSRQDRPNSILEMPDEFFV